MSDKQKVMTDVAEPILFDYSLGVARKVLPFLGRMGIPATPQNYMIFYAYFEGGSDKIQKVVDDELELDRGWTEETSRHIFDLLFSDEVNLSWHQLNERLASRIKTVTQDIIDETETTASRAEKTGDRINSELGRAKAAADMDELAKLLAAIALDVGEMGRATRSLGQTLKAKGAQLDEALQALDEVEHLALTDDLTRLGNRRAWEARIRDEFHRYQRYKTGSSVIMIDLDDFKSVNDRHGHLVGDKVLTMIGSIILGLLRESDFGARYGGEEFALLLPSTDIQGGVALAERVRRALEVAGLKDGADEVEVRASFGVSVFHPEDNSARKAMERADRALYQAKAQGKNRTASEEDQPPESD